MEAKNIVGQIVERRRLDIKHKGLNFGTDIPHDRKRPVVPFMTDKGAILEVKRASPSKGDIAPHLDSVRTALEYRRNGATAISCLTEQNYFKGSLQDLIDIADAVDDAAVLRKDFLLEEQEIDISYRCGADAVLLICGILSEDKLLSMTKRCYEYGMRALIEVRSDDDAAKALKASEAFPQTVVFGVNSRNLTDFSIDLLVPAMQKQRLNGDVIFESGITTPKVASLIGAMGFKGILLGEYAARDPQNVHNFVSAFKNASVNANGAFLLRLAEKISRHKLSSNRPLIKICGLTRIEDVRLCAELGADFLGFVFSPGFERNVCGQRFDLMKDELRSVETFKAAVVTEPESAEGQASLQFVRQGVLDCIQLHGVDINCVPQSFLDVPHYFAATSGSQITADQYDMFWAEGEPRFLQDCKSHNYLESPHSWIAGGITPENVLQLTETFRPELIDISGGVEGSQKGIKDENKLRRLFATDF